MPGLLIAVEGIDGSGITTHALNLVNNLRKRANMSKVYYTKEPTRETIGILIREIIQGFYPSLQRNEIYALLFAADRFHHLYMKVAGQPPEKGGLLHLVAHENAVIVMDRYKYSSIAYQSTEISLPGRSLGKVDKNYVKELNKFAPPPHILVYLNVSPQTAYKRIREKRRETFQIFEAATASKHTKDDEAPTYLKNLADELRRIVNRLKARPEYCPAQDDRPAWSEKLRELVGLSEFDLYPETHCYPCIVIVNEEVRGNVLPENEVSNAIYAAVVKLFHKLGYSVDRVVLREAETLYNEEKDKGIIDIVCKEPSR